MCTGTGVCVVLYAVTERENSMSLGTAQRHVVYLLVKPADCVVGVCPSQNFRQFQMGVEINNDYPKENKQEPFPESLLWQENQPPSLVFGRDSEGGSGEERFYSEKREGFRCVPVGGYCPGEPGGGPARSGAACTLGLEAHLAFSSRS